jgi:hypothetical protein
MTFRTEEERREALGLGGGKHLEDYVLEDTEECAVHDKHTLFYENLPDGGQVRHWMCRTCLLCSADPPSSAN